MVSQNNRESIKGFIQHIWRCLRSVKLTNLTLGVSVSLSTYFEICIRYLIVELIFKKYIHSQRLFGKQVYVPYFRSFITLFETIFLHNEYFFQTNNQKPIVIDCGANIGISVLYFKLLYPTAIIIAIEPDPLAFKYLQKNTISMDSIVLINKAISNKKGLQDFYTNTDQFGSLMMSLNRFRVPNLKKIKIATVPLSQTIEKYPRIDFVKMDIEGEETNVLSELRASGQLNKIDQIIMEYHHHIQPYDNTMSKVLQILESCKYSYSISTFKPYTPFVKGVYQDILIFAYC